MKRQDNEEADDKDNGSEVLEKKKENEKMNRGEEATNERVLKRLRIKSRARRRRKSSTGPSFGKR